jgi:predicted DNA helicase
MHELTGGFDVVVIDEATQSIEPSCLIPMVKGQKWVMAGDHKQLPPTVLHPKAEQELQYSLFERLIRDYDESIKSLLNVQYRMHEAIMHFPNKTFYDGRIKAHKSVAQHTLADFDITRPDEEAGSAELVQPEPPAVFLDTKHFEAQWERQRKRSHSRENPLEAKIVERLARSLVNMGIEEAQIGIISPYDDQVDLIQQKLNDCKELEVKTVDGFQGREKEVIILSFVRANKKENIGFLTDLRRLNVAITRARRKLIMVGHSPTLQNHETYQALIKNTPQGAVPKAQTS